MVVNHLLFNSEPIFQNHQIGFMVAQPIHIVPGFFAKALQFGLAQGRGRDDLRLVGFNASFPYAHFIGIIHQLRQQMVIHNGITEGFQQRTGMMQYLGVIHRVPKIKGVVWGTIHIIAIFAQRRKKTTNPVRLVELFCIFRLGKTFSLIDTRQKNDHRFSQFNEGLSL